MKKITAILVSLIMSCTVMAGCGSDSSSSSKDSTASSAAQTADESKADENTASSEDTLAAQYTNNIMSKNFAYDVVVSGEFDDDTPATVEVADGNAHMSITTMGIALDFYIIDDVMYTLDSDTKTYIKSDAYETIDEFKAEIGYGIGDEYKFIGTENTDDGLICETYEATQDLGLELGSGVTLDESDSDLSYTATIKYYFNADTKDIVKIETIVDGSTSSITFNSFTTENVTVKLPDDFDSWTEQTADDLGGDVIDDAELDLGLDSAAE